VWAGDAPAFARVYAWTFANMARPDHLLAWHWGRLPDGSQGILDANTASDGDLDYALALTLAAKRGWQAPMGLPAYLAEAREVLAAIWEKEVVALPAGAKILTPGNWHEAKPPYLLNPSYFSPAAYRLFSKVYGEQPPPAVPGQAGGTAVSPFSCRLNAHESNMSYPQGMKIPPAPLFQRGVQSPPLEKGDLGGFDFFPVKPAAANGNIINVPRLALAEMLVGPTHSPSPLRGTVWGWVEWAGVAPVGAVLEPPAWDRLHQDTYQLLAHLNERLDNQGAGLFPDWCQIDAQGHLSPAPDRETQFGWEAVRLPWRLALDHLWFKEHRAAQILAQKFLPFFQQEWQSRGKLAALYNFNGAPAADYESPVLYAGVLAAAQAAGDRDFAGLMAQKILSFYHETNGQAYFVSPDNYYANNWAWLGLALYAGWVKP
jgi:endo-1,4-beta-D-glucanase Y